MDLVPYPCDHRFMHHQSCDCFEEEGTGGYDILRSNMTKEECREAWNYFVSTGTNPDYLKIVRES